MLVEDSEVLMTLKRTKHGIVLVGLSVPVTC